MNDLVFNPICHFRRSLFGVALCFVLAISVGCDQPKETGEGGDQSSGTTDVAEGEAKSYLEQANVLFQQAKDAGQTSASNAGEWINETVSGAMQSTGDVAQDTGNWVNETFESLKERGMTTAGSATDWVQEDFQNMSAFEYRILPNNDEVTEEALNELGKQRWECFAVDARGFYFKRQRKSYLRNVPVKDLLKFIPLSGEE